MSEQPSTAPRQRQGRNPLRAAARKVGAFSLIEILIVVLILGVLAAIVIPELSSASRQAREGVLKDDVRFMREQIFRYKVQHDDVAPGYPSGNSAGVPTEAEFIAQMTGYTDLRGNTNAAYTNVFRYGPYLTRIPDNPITGRSGVHVVANGGALPAADRSQPYGWIYKPETGEFIPNLDGTDLESKAYINY